MTKTNNNAMTTINELLIERNQGLGDDGREIGYISTAHADDGGYFFAWMPTLDATLESLEADDTDRPTFGLDIARQFLRSQIAYTFAAE